MKAAFFPFCKGEKRRYLAAGEEPGLPFEGKKIPAHMTRANIWEMKTTLTVDIYSSKFGNGSIVSMI
jgi:hypothetical protein